MSGGVATDGCSRSMTASSGLRAGPPSPQPTALFLACTALAWQLVRKPLDLETRPQTAAVSRPYRSAARVTRARSPQHLSVTHGAALGPVVPRGAFGSRGSSGTRRAGLALLTPFSFGSLEGKASVSVLRARLRFPKRRAVLRRDARSHAWDGKRLTGPHAGPRAQDYEHTRACTHGRARTRRCTRVLTPHPPPARHSSSRSQA